MFPSPLTHGLASLKQESIEALEQALDLCIRIGDLRPRAMSAANFGRIVKAKRRAGLVRSSSLLVKVFLATITMRLAVCRSGGSYTAASRHHLRRKCSKLQGRTQFTQNDVCNLILSLLLLPAFVESIFQVQLGVSNTDTCLGDGVL